MAEKGLTEEERRELIGPLAGTVLLRRIFPLLQRLAPCGTERDTARNRQLFYSQYAALLLIGFFNPVLKSARALVAASGLKKVQQLAGGQKVSAGAFPRPRPSSIPRSWKDSFTNSAASSPGISSA